MAAEARRPLATLSETRLTETRRARPQVRPGPRRPARRAGDQDGVVGRGGRQGGLDGVAHLGHHQAVDAAARRPPAASDRGVEAVGSGRGGHDHLVEGAGLHRLEHGRRRRRRPTQPHHQQPPAAARRSPRPGWRRPARPRSGVVGARRRPPGGRGPPPRSGPGIDDRGQALAHQVVDPGRGRRRPRPRPPPAAASSPWCAPWSGTKSCSVAAERRAQVDQAPAHRGQVLVDLEVDLALAGSRPGRVRPGSGPRAPRRARPAPRTAPGWSPSSANRGGRPPDRRCGRATVTVGGQPAAGGVVRTRAGPPRARPRRPPPGRTSRARRRSSPRTSSASPPPAARRSATAPSASASSSSAIGSPLRASALVDLLELRR